MKNTKLYKVLTELDNTLATFAAVKASARLRDYFSGVAVGKQVAYQNARDLLKKAFPAILDEHPDEQLS